MDIRAYIQSGVIESYVLGLAGAEEVIEVEELRKQNFEIEEAIKGFSVDLERQALENAIAPPPEVKYKVMAAIKRESTGKANISPIFSLSTNTEGSSIVNIEFLRKWKMVAAASIIMLIASAVLNIYFYNKYQDQKSAFLALSAQQNTLQANNQIYQTRLREWKTAAEMMADPEMAIVKMPDAAGKNRNFATIFWNTRNKDVYLLPNKLPQPTSGKQYQLWALVNGKPVDAGMLDANCNGVCKMKNIPRAEAFAITLENMGGSVTPTMEALFVLGKV